jgi:hypothetical protein
MIIAIPFAFLLLGAAPAAAAPDPPPPRPVKICRETERNLGTHIRSARRCLTAEQWQAEDEARGRTPPSLTVTQGQQDGNPGRTPQ